MIFPVLLDDVKRKAIWKRMATTERANLIGLWLMAEAAGTVSIDSSPQGNDGVYTDVTLGQAPYADGRTSALYGGDGDRANFYSAGLASDFNGAEGTVVFPFKVASSSIWTDGVVRALLIFRADTNNYVNIQRQTPNNSLDFYYKAGGTLNSARVNGITSADWIMGAITWSKSADEVNLYLDAVAQVAPITGLGTWVGAIDSGRAIFGANDSGGSIPWHGYGAYLGLWTKALTQPQLARMLPA